jgi:transcriptional regulator with GAF, ATPase, and Fis domain
MVRSIIIVVSDDAQTTEQAKMFGQARGLDVKVYSHSQWAQENANSSKSVGLPGGTSTQSGTMGGNVLPFPGQVPSTATAQTSGTSKRVATINELESIAIENAIYEYNGNLTEAARALGIGRATLYRKVKQYSIDPSAARKKRRAA